MDINRSRKFSIDGFSYHICRRVRRNETICCLIGFGLGVGCCILYRIVSNILTPSKPKLYSKEQIESLKNDYLITTKHEYDDNNRTTTTNNQSDEMTWSEMSSSLSTINLFQDSFTGDSGVDCPENHDHNEIFLQRTDTQTSTDLHTLSTEKGLERALEQTSRFYTDLEHIASDLGTLTQRYSQSQRSIDALDWDLNDDENLHSPKNLYRKQIRSNNKTKVRRRLNTTNNQTEYNESDHEKMRSLDFSNSPLRRKHSSVYFDSTDNTSDEENIGDETLQIN